jgi:hypothetical protein
MPQPKILKVNPLNDYKLKLLYETGEIRIFDVSPYIHGSWYSQLKDKDYFKKVRIIDNGAGIEWENGQDIAPHELYDTLTVEN